MKMFGRKLFTGLVVTVLATACLGFGAWGFHKSSERGTDVTFSSTTKFNNGDTLPAGTYRMEVPDNSPTPEVMFYREYREDGLTQQVGYKPMATIKAKVVPQQEKNPETEIFSVMSGNAQLVTKIQPAGWSETLTFGAAGYHGSAHAGQ